MAKAAGRGGGGRRWRMGACVELIDGAPAPHLHETRGIGLGLPAGGSAGGWVLLAGDPSMPARPAALGADVCFSLLGNLG